MKPAPRRSSEVGVVIYYHPQFFITIATNIRQKKFRHKIRDNWWHGMQHGIGLIGHTAPCNFLRNIKMLYIATSFAGIKVTCASWPTIDNMVKFCGCSVVHDAFIEEQEKIAIIVEKHYSNKLPVKLHVCWQNASWQKLLDVCEGVAEQ